MSPKARDHKPNGDVQEINCKNKSPKGSTNPSNNSEAPAVLEKKILKHPLRDSWTLWYFKFNKSKDWSDNLVEVFTFNTIEDFWGLYTYLQPVSTLSPGIDYSLFKTGITPMWEDAENREGGRWLIKSERQHRNSALDRMWLELLLYLIGGDERTADEVNGGYINVRQKFNKVSLWMRNREKKAIVMEAGATFKECIGVDRRIKVEFEFHEDSSNRSSSSAVYRYVV
nr:Eukaryotic translation initiation factor 4E [Lepeophtheirus salmonis]